MVSSTWIVFARNKVLVDTRVEVPDVVSAGVLLYFQPWASHTRQPRCPRVRAFRSAVLGCQTGAVIQPDHTARPLFLRLFLLALPLSGDSVSGSIWTNDGSGDGCFPYLSPMA